MSQVDRQAGASTGTNGLDHRSGLVGNTAFKAPVRAATTANNTLSGEQTIDGVACVELDRVLVKNQTNTVDNGIWVVSTGAWNRAADFDGQYDSANGTLVMVIEGSVSSNLVFQVYAADPIVIGTSLIEFVLWLRQASYDIAGFLSGVPANSQILLWLPMVRAVTFDVNLALSKGAANVAATASTTFNIAKNGVNFGTMVFALGATTATFVASIAQSFAVGDILSVTGPASADATLANVGFILCGEIVL
jgi:hypothetical protein